MLILAQIRPSLFVVVVVVAVVVVNDNLVVVVVVYDYDPRNLVALKI